ncbi:MAG: DNA internalization-related competence protein ComEC/Rec2 [Oscillospiraceae bacterium]|nr:DNA internalization-related competence protein ComEC/Rec2 [Oscillospiraceae bacterium]
MRKLAIFTAAFAIMAALYVYDAIDGWAVWLAVGMLVLSVSARGMRFRRASIFFLGAAMSLLWCLCYEQVFLRDIVLLDGTEQTVCVQVLEHPQETDRGAYAICGYDDRKVLLYGGADLLKADVGDLVTCRVTVKTKTDDRGSRASGTVAVFYGKGGLSIEPGTMTLPQRLRTWLQGRIDLLYKGQTRALVKALLTGDRSDLSYKIYNALSVAGLSHAVAVSGMHVSILVGMLALLFGKSSRLTAVLGIPIIVSFALMTGASPSVCRAAVMQILLLLAPLVRRERDDITSLAAAAFVLLAQDPWCIASVSFQLSFAAVAGLMLFSSTIQKKLLLLLKGPKWIRRFVASGVAATLSATLITLPLTMFYFGMVSIVGLPVNLLTLWAVELVFVWGLISCLIGSLGTCVAFAVDILSRYILQIAVLVSKRPFSAAYVQNIPLMLCAVAGYLLAVVASLRKSIPVRWCACAVLVLYLVGILSSHISFLRDPWHMAMLDVGQGQCVVLRIGDLTAMIDCGGSDAEDAGEYAARFLHSAGIRKIDALILTHYDDDHAGGAVQLMDRVQVDTVFLPAIGADCEIGTLIAEAAPQVHYVSSAAEIRVPNGSITLFPPVFSENDNNAGVCVLAMAEKYDILITGDIDAMAELRLLSRWHLPQVELLVAGHHGAATSSCAPFLEAVCPQFVAISVSADNTYGHPHEEALQRFEEIGAEIYRTDLMGDLHFYPERR